MTWILIIRIVIWLTFFLLIVEGGAGLIIVRRFYLFYVREHIKLEGRISALERRAGLGVPGGHD